MRSTSKLILIGSVVGLLYCSRSYAQTIYTDTAARAAMIDNIIAGFSESASDPSRLYTGNVYHADKAQAGALAFTPGSVAYDGFVFNNVPLLYDVKKDVIVTNLPGKKIGVELVGNRVQNFDLLGRRFIRIDAKITDGADDLSSGFYEELYAGATTLIVKRKAGFTGVKSEAAKDSPLASADKMYVMVNGTYTPVDGTRSLLGLLNNKRKVLQNFLKVSQGSAAAGREAEMVKLLTYYDQLNSGAERVVSTR